jgi:hypothetical protein
MPHRLPSRDKQASNEELSVVSSSYEDTLSHSLAKVTIETTAPAGRRTPKIPKARSMPDSMALDQPSKPHLDQ